MCVNTGCRSTGRSPHLATMLGPAVVVLRICYTYGLSMHFDPGPNAFRAIGAGGTALAIMIRSAA
jgi:hypothetical protein